MQSDRFIPIRAANLSACRGQDPLRRRAAANGRSPNPWLRHLAPVIPPPAAPPVRTEPLRTLSLAPQPGVAAPAAGDRLPRRLLGPEERPVALWWVGAHGGAGESSLEQLLPGSRAANHAWPLCADPGRPARAMLIARTSHAGLRAAQRALRHWGSGSLAIELLGLVLIADAPGRRPPELRALSRLVASAAPGATWELPWQPEWRLGPPVLERASRQARQLVAHLNPKEA
jgi:hypothetical protein